MDISKNLLIWASWFFTDSICDVTHDDDDDVGDIDDGDDGGFMMLLI